MTALVSSARRSTRSPRARCGLRRTRVRSVGDSGSRLAYGSVLVGIGRSCNTISTRLNRVCQQRSAYASALRTCKPATTP